MRRRVALAVCVAVLAGLAPGAWGAFRAATATAPQSFTTAADTAAPRVGARRITRSPDCADASTSPPGTIRQGATYYVCAQGVTDTGGSGVASVTVDASRFDTGVTAATLTAVGGLASGFTHRSGPLVADVPQPTQRTLPYVVSATDGAGSRHDHEADTVGIQSFHGFLLGEYAWWTAHGGLAQYHRFGETSGTTAADSTFFGGFRPGTYHGGVTLGVPGGVPGSTDTAARFDGVDDRVTVPLPPTQDFAVQFLFRSSRGVGATTNWWDAAGLVSADVAGVTNDWGIGLNADGRVLAGCGNPDVSIASPPGLADGAWHHVVMSRRRQGPNELALHVDGVRVATTSACNDRALDAAWFSGVSVGRAAAGSQHLAGDVDELSMFATSLTRPEVVDLRRLAMGLDSEEAVAPVLARTEVARTTGGTPGTLRQGADFHVYAQVADAGTPATGVEVVRADVDGLKAGLRDATLVPGSWTVGGQSYNFRTADPITADSPLNPGGTRAYAVQALDGAGNRARRDGVASIESYAQVVAATAGVRGHWRFGDAAGATAAAAVIGGATGTYVGGPALAQGGALAGDRDGAVRLDGVDDRIAIPDGVVTDRGDGPFTLELWIRRSGTATPRPVLDKDAGAYALRFGTGGFELARSGTGTVAAASSTPGDTSAFHHYVVTRAAGAARVYVDGVDVTGTQTAGTLIDSAAALQVGANATLTGFLDATVDELAIYDQALSAATVLDHLRAGRGTG